jgi:glycosyltransferase involved in cell wall biosynthesis
MEAMACGRPVVLSDIPPHREIAEGVDFIPLIRPDDVAGFAREIKRFKEMSVPERTMIGQKCRKLIEERFSLPIMHAGYKKVYAKITGNQAPSILEMIG